MGPAMNSTQRSSARQIIERIAEQLRFKRAWHTLQEPGLPEWVSTRLRKPSPPAYELQAEQVDVPSSVQRVELKESGLSRIYLSGADGVGPIEQTLAAITTAAFAIDNRTPVVEERPASDFIVTVLRSQIPDYDLPVLG